MFTYIVSANNKTKISEENLTKDDDKISFYFLRIIISELINFFLLNLIFFLFSNSIHFSMIYDAIFGFFVGTKFFEENGV